MNWQMKFDEISFDEEFDGIWSIDLIVKGK